MKETQKLMMSKIFGLEVECADLRKELTKIKDDCDDASLGNIVFHPETESEDFVSDAQWLFTNGDVPGEKTESDHYDDKSQNDKQIHFEAAENNPASQHSSDVANTSEPIAKVWEFLFHNLP